MNWDQLRVSVAGRMDAKFNDYLAIWTGDAPCRDGDREGKRLWWEGSTESKFDAFKRYIELIRTGTGWAGGVEIQCVCDLFLCQIAVYTLDEDATWVMMVFQRDETGADKHPMIRLRFKGSHYDTLQGEHNMEV